METHTPTLDQTGRRLVGHFQPATPVFVFDQAGKQIGRFKS
jgi:hypothetical protein